MMRELLDRNEPLALYELQELNESLALFELWEKQSGRLELNEPQEQSGPLDKRELLEHPVRCANLEQALQVRKLPGKPPQSKENQSNSTQ